MKKTLILLLVITALFSAMLPVGAQAAQAASAGTVTTAGGRLNVRAKASTNSAVLATLANRSYVTLLEKSGSWWRVSYGKGLYGYVSGSYITQSGGQSATVATTSGNLNVRSGPGTNHGRIGSLWKGETVVVLSTANGWSRILYHGVSTGYVSSAYLSTGSGSVKLSVPSYKQTDSRWSSVRIGTSGKTMGQIGCATTAIAMMESYRAGKTIYPDAMSRQLRYTASGNVYWPADYVTVTDSGNDLARIQKLLQQGKPVLFGAKNASGSQHWVVITGFSGGQLQAENFLINDPGSSSRTTLQQFLSSYPNFYKYFYY